MPVLKRSSTKGSNSVTAKLINKTKANIGLHNNINNHLNENNISELTKNQNQYNHYHTKSDDEVIVLTAKQKQQLLRNEYLEQLTKEQLKIEAKRRGQKTSGTKSELLQRLGYKMSLKHSVSLNNIKQTSAGQMKTSQSSNGSLPAGGNGKNSVDKERLRKEREHLKLWIHPITTIKYFGYECVTLFQLYKKNFMNNKKTIAFLTVIIALIAALWYVPGKHQIYIEEIRKHFFFIVYWVGLGVLSSVGLGTGLHTFLLYLGPHIASVTLAAYECNSLDFPEPPYPNDIVCPDDVTPGFIPSLWNIMTKVRYEAFLWGAGTALGELPPYFMAKAARLSGHDPDDAEEMDEFEKLQKKNELGDLNFFDKIKLFMERTVERVGFFGILACASIPNPLFDLAGITCGHFLVPFWTFFGATLIGKAVIKMHIQKILVIVAFNEILIEKAVDKIAFIPVIGKRLQEPFKSFLQNQKTKLHRGKTDKMGGGNLLQKVFEVFVIGMVIYFVVSIINSFAQSYHKRIHKKPSKKLRKSGKEN